MNSQEIERKGLSRKLIDILEEEKPNPQNALIAIAYVAAYLLDTQTRKLSYKKKGATIFKKLIIDFLERANEK